MRRQGPAEAGVAGDRGVPDPVDRLDGVDDPDRVQPPPPTTRPHAGAHLEVQVPVRVPRPARVVPHHHRLHPVDGDLDLPAPRPTRVVACAASQPMTSVAARSCAPS